MFMATKKKAAKRKAAKRRSTTVTFTTIESLRPMHMAALGPQVEVAYQLTKSVDLQLYEIEFGELYEPADLDDDYVSPTSYRTKDSKTYQAFLNDERKLKVRVYVRGRSGHKWEMTVQVNGNPIALPQPKKTLSSDGYDVYEIHHKL
jgi:hypothetical protein